MLDSGTKLCGAGLGAPFAEADGNKSIWRTSGPTAVKDQDIVIHESTNNGVAWGPARVVSRKADSRDGMPSVVRQSDHCILCVFEGTATGGFKSNSIRSCDDGQTWVRQSVSTSTQTSAGHAPTVAVLPNGYAAVASYDNNNDIQLQLSAVPLSGTTNAQWSAPTKLITGLAAPGWPDVFTDESGQLWLAYADRGTKVIGPLSIKSAVTSLAAMQQILL